MSFVNPKPYFGKFATDWVIPAACVHIMIEAFKTGTHFIVTDKQWSASSTGYRFEGWCSTNTTTNICTIRVSNDERRRILPILENIYGIFLRTHIPPLKTSLLDMPK